MNAIATEKNTALDVLVVEDDRDTASAMQRILESAGFSANHVQSLADAFETVRLQPPSIVLLDLSLPDGDGVDAIKTLTAGGQTQVIVISGTDDAERTRKCLQAGVFDFLVKPAEARELVFAVRRADGHRRKGVVSTTSYPPELKMGFGALVGTSPASQNLVAQVRNAAAAEPCHALITGQPGVLKADIAALLHRYSKRAGRGYIISCASETGQPAIDRFFGDSKRPHEGGEKGIEAYLKKADGGTLVLDDVSSLPVDIQRRLVSFMSSGTVLASNALTPDAYDCAVVGILREPVEDALSSGRLYDRFYYALAKNCINVPPLVERKADIEYFARSAVQQLNQVFDTEKSLSEEIVAQLRGHYWPGNQVELKNTLLTAYRLTEAGDEIAADLSLFVENESGVSDQIAPFIGQTFSEVEKQLIEATLIANDNNKSQTAKVLGISLKTLYNRLNSYEKERASVAEI
ncbi:sigma-54-dependent transcriptional regulator [Granulosicoccus antarcticus]|uniref:Transcriptional regulatory protein ZraR n=1 Tax=Granulosicoccus antarcticus IMCC3135 TaxID=1192854 RepID=A0A2Z2NSR3_9GAMM|nr:response regulator [Granulosicoccus antarcticus]ASJ74339.1 Transcriptional regulatory protein ZraR [Granulosicoccus antarcticus IMCC3135]